jgi:Asp-tRNA(Asn)/Glu-tRNA(Gln) amidotransferase A subunit family amidase
MMIDAIRLRKLRAGLSAALVLAGILISVVRPAARRQSDDAFVHPALGQTQAPSADATFDVVEKSILELQEAMRSGRATSERLVELYLARIRKYDKQGPAINAFIAINPRAGETARGLDEERRTRGARGPLHGIPIVVKDNFATVDLPTTAASRALEGFETRRDAFLVKRLRDAGAVILGKTNLHELAYGITTISSLGGQTRNPYDPTRNPGGSSGGTGAAITASFAAAGLGSDTCGSIRNPAASNNLVGLRGTMGLSSRDGIVPLSHSQDIGGPLARSVTDLAIMLDATVGPDAADPVTSASQGRIPRTYLSTVGDSSLADVRIGVFTPLLGSAPEDEEVAAIVRGAIDATRRLGASVVDVVLPGFDELIMGTSVINAEFKFDLMDFLARYPAAPVRTLGDVLDSGRYDPAVDGVLKRANAVESRMSDTYRQALDKRVVVRRTIEELMAERGLAALAYPTLRRKPAVIGQPQGGSNCQLSATTGLPAISIPAGFTADGLPVGLDLLGRAFSEPTLLKVAFAYERDVGLRRPPPLTP